MSGEDILDRLRAACIGHPAATIPWPHRLLHDAIAEIDRLRQERDHWYGLVARADIAQFPFIPVSAD